MSVKTSVSGSSVKQGRTGGRAADEPVGRLLFCLGADSRFCSTTHAQTPPQFPLFRGRSESGKRQRAQSSLTLGISHHLQIGFGFISWSHNEIPFEPHFCPSSERPGFILVRTVNTFPQTLIRASDHYAAGYLSAVELYSALDRFYTTLCSSDLNTGRDLGFGLTA